ncbi:MAG: lysophospholipase [Symploca sp. SIO3E6]|nr:lysophospholipase [Caldora sp. SIO3E6]
MSIHFKNYPGWAVFSLAVNGLLVLAIVWLLLRESHLSVSSAVVGAHRRAPSSSAELGESKSMAKPKPELGARHKLNYQQWVELLAHEAQAVSNQQPENLTILAGDSLSLWFPLELLPPETTWLNQGISGETSAGLLNRIDLFDDTEPDVVFVMIGINDLIRGIRGETIVANQELTIRHLRRAHPKAQIVVQSILPHSAEQATWEGRDRLLSIPNSNIQKINQRLKKIAQREGAIYLELYPLFADTNGNLNTELSTDGLHLNQQGYQVWSYALQVLNQVLLDSEDLSVRSY